MKDHWVILGKLESKFMAPFDDPNCTIISMNKHDDEDLIPRVDIWVDLHEYPVRKKADFTKANFPFDECHELVGRRFCTTAAYLIAFAILEGATHISLYGMRFTPDHERRIRELHNVREMIFYAWGRGITVDVPVDYEYLIPEHIPDVGMDFDQ